MNTAQSRATIIMGLAVAFAIAPAASQEFPSKPVRIIVPFNAGGAMDILGRVLAPPMSRAWGQNVLVDNRPGGGTIIGTELVAKAPADGYTLLIMANSFTIQQVKEGLDKLGLSPGVMDAEQFAAFVRAELQKNEKTARYANMRVD